MINKHFDWVFFLTERLDIAASFETVSWWRRALRAFTRGNERHAVWMQNVWKRRALGVLSLVYARTQCSKITVPLPTVVSRFGRVKHPRRFVRWEFSVRLSDSLSRTFRARKFTYLVAGLWEVITTHGDDYFEMNRSAQRRQRTYEWLDAPAEVSE